MVVKEESCGLLTMSKIEHQCLLTFNLGMAKPQQDQARSVYPASQVWQLPDYLQYTFQQKECSFNKSHDTSLSLVFNS